MTKDFRLWYRREYNIWPEDCSNGGRNEYGAWRAATKRAAGIAAAMICPHCSAPSDACGACIAAAIRDTGEKT